MLRAGQLKPVSSPDSIFCDYAYDGPLLTLETWRGRVLGSVTHGYDNAFRPKTESVNGSATVSYGYDADGPLNQLAGAWGTMTLSRDPVSGLLSGTSIGTVASTLGYNVHGELTDLDYTVGSAPYYHEHLVRDALGRITQIDETIAGTSTSRTYGYDTAGRLASVTEAGNASASRGWEYDAGQPGNGNRTLATYGPGVAPDSAYYDDQDRLLRYGNETFGAAYDWTTAGELVQRTRPDQRLTTTYDALGNLTAASLKPLVNGSEQPGVSTTTTVTYRIDGQNRRVERVLSGPSGVTTQRWLYRDGLAPVAELDGANAVCHTAQAGCASGCGGRWWSAAPAAVRRSSTP